MSFTKMIYPHKEKYSMDCSCIYLIQTVDEYNFPIFRSLTDEEYQSRINNTIDWIISYEDKPYLYLHNFPSFDEAIKAVQSYWNAIDQLVEKHGYKNI